MVRRFQHAWVDDARAPVYLLCPPDAPSLEEVVALCAAMESFLAASKEPFGWVTDLARLHRVGAVQRRAFFEANKRWEHELGRAVIAMGVAAPRPIQRGLVTAFNWMSPPRFPLRVFGHVADATTWVLEQVAKATPVR